MTYQAGVGPRVAAFARPTVGMAGVPSSWSSSQITWPCAAGRRATPWGATRPYGRHRRTAGPGGSARIRAERLGQQRQDVQILGVALGVWVLVMLAITPYA
jgi:hypothetical protein